MNVPVVLVSAVDPVLRAAATGVLTTDLPGAGVDAYDVRRARPTVGVVVATTAGVVEADEIAVSGCLSCAVRDDAAARIVRLAMPGSGPLFLAPPITMDPVPLAMMLRQADLGPAVLAASAVALDADTLLDDLFGDALLVERGHGFGPVDRRAVGEALVRQLETADLVLTVGTPDERTRAALDHLIGQVPDRADLYTVDPAALTARRRPRALDRRGDLRLAAPTGAPDTTGVWTLDLHSWKPLHPQRLLEHLAHLGAGRIRGRGYFWLPTRPGLQCAWDGSGGQLSIGELDRWSQPPHTRLVVTGVEGDPDTLRRVFESTLLTDAELAAGLHRWRDHDDGLDTWLGPQPDHCAQPSRAVGEEAD
jgi:G3E family GTPase